MNASPSAGQVDGPARGPGRGPAQYPVGGFSQDAVARGEWESAPQRVLEIYAAQTIERKDHVSAGLLAVFLGMFGIHKFYLGYYQTAFAMLAVSIIGGLLTIGIASAVMWVIAIVEGIIYLTRTQTDFDRAYVLNKRDWF